MFWCNINLILLTSCWKQDWAIIGDLVKDFFTSFNCDSNLSVLDEVFNCQGVCSGGGAGGVYNHTLRQLSIVNRLSETRPNALKAF